MNAAREAVRPDAVARVAAVVLAVLLVAFAAWQYAMPPGAWGPWGLDVDGVAHFRRALGVSVPALSDARFRAGLFALLASLCVAYLVFCAATVAGGTLRPRSVAALSAVLALVLALLCPPSLSSDVYAYVGYARLAVVHHLNPYAATQLDLVRLGDPTASYLHWPISSPYGPLWTLISMLPVALAPGAPLWAHVVIMKMIAAGGVLVLAAGGRRLAERLSPGHGPITFAALALNPLLLVEGPGNGHNDLVMSALVIWALATAAERRPVRALALVGLGAAVKLVPMLLAPWLVGRTLRERPRVAFVVVAVLATLAPVALSYAPFWIGADTLRGLLQRWRVGGGATAAWAGPAAAAAAYACLSAWVIAGDHRRVVTGWVVASTVVILFAVGICFPWYAGWPFAAAVALQGRRGWITAGLLFCFAAALSLRYAAAL